jgi:hypothetical protein
MSHFAHSKYLGLLLCASLGAPSISTAQVIVDDDINVSGVWLDADRSAQGLMLEQLDPPRGAADGGDSRVGVTWFTWAPASDPNPGPRWMFGIGRRDGDTIVVDPMRIAVRGSYPYVSGDAVATFADWGRVEIQVPEWRYGQQNSAVLTYEGPTGWGSGSREIRQITVASTGYAYDIAFSPPIVAPYFASAGTYSDPTSVGQGWILNHYWRYDPDAAGGLSQRVETGLLWFSFDEDGRPTWYLGIDPNLDDAIPTFPMLQADSGGTFEGGAPVLEARATIYIRGSGGPPFGINCAEPNLIRIDRFPELAVTPPPPWQPLSRITRTFDPNVVPPELCFSR